MNNRIDAIYARQSVDKKDSISIESQIEFCKYELKGGNCKEYTDKGYSGKNTDRPKFQELVRDIKRGLIAKVVVYKLDRISRSILDFANMMELFQQYNVEFVSSTEKFDTSTPMGRAMLNICIVFAQLERETIQKRVTDAYYSRSQRGFKMGGKAPYGFHTEPIKMGLRPILSAKGPKISAPAIKPNKPAPNKGAKCVASNCHASFNAGAIKPTAAVSKPSIATTKKHSAMMSFCVRDNGCASMNCCTSMLCDA